MAKRLIRSTFGFEPVGPDSEVRRFLGAGSFLPESITRLEDPSAVEDQDYIPGPGLGAGGPSGPQYTHQREAAKPKAKPVDKAAAQAAVKAAEQASAGSSAE